MYIDTEILTIDEACELLLVGKNTLYQLLSSGKIPGAFRIGKVWKIPKKAILDYIAARMKETTTAKTDTRNRIDRSVR